MLVDTVRFSLKKKILPSDWSIHHNGGSDGDRVKQKKKNGKFYLM